MDQIERDDFLKVIKPDGHENLPCNDDYEAGYKNGWKDCYKQWKEVYDWLYKKYREE